MDDTYYIQISEMEKNEVIWAKHKVLNSFEENSKLSRFGYLFAYLLDWEGIRTIFFFLLKHPFAIFNVLLTFIKISNSGFGMAGTNPKNKFTKKASEL